MKNTNNDKARIVNIIKKLFALSKSPNEHEAEIALAKAHELLAKFKLDESELDKEYLEQEYSDNNIVQVFTGVYYNKRLPIYKDILAAYIARFFECESLKGFPVKIDNKLQKGIKFIGFPVDVEIAIYAYNYILNYIDKTCSKYRRQLRLKNQPIPKNFKNSYTIGFIDNLDNKLEVLRTYKKKNEVNNINTNVSNYENLLAIKEKSLVKYMQDVVGSIDTGTVRVHINDGVKQTGYQDANKFNINVAVNNSGNSGTYYNNVLT